MNHPALGAALVAAFLCACPKKQVSEQDPGTIAIVNDELISKSEFEKEFRRELRFLGSSDSISAEQLGIIKATILNTLIDRALLLQIAKQRGIAVTPEEVDRRVLRVSSDYPAESFNEALAQNETTMPEFRQKTSADILTEKLFEQEVYARVAVTEEELRRHFEEHKSEFQEPEQVHAAQIVVRELDDARRIRQQLRQGKSFAELARKYSLSPDAKVGGDLGFFERGKMPPQFDEVTFKLEVGQVSEVISTEYGYHLFKVMERRSARRRDFGEVRGQVEQKLLKLRRAEAQAEYVKNQKEHAKIKVNEQALAAVVASRRPAESDSARH